MALRDLWRKLTRRGKEDAEFDLRPTRRELADASPQPDARTSGSLSRWSEEDEPKH
jgi:hypothetical protein